MIVFACSTSALFSGAYPDERVWNDLKNNTIGRKSIESKEQLRKNVIGFLRQLQCSPSRVRSYFANETTRYAA